MRPYFYVLREVLLPTVVSFVVAMVFLLGNALYERASLILGKSLPLPLVAKLVVLAAPSFVPMALPISILFGVLIGVSGLNQHGEIEAMMTGGVNLKKVFGAVLGMGLLFSFFSYYVSDRVVPPSSREMEETVRKFASSLVLERLRPGVFLKGPKNYVLLMEGVFGERAYGVVAFHTDEFNEIDEVMVAKRGYFAPGGKEFVLENGEYVSFERNIGLRTVIDFKTGTINLGRELSSFWRSSTDYTALSLKDLARKANEEAQKKRFKRATALRVILHSRISLFLAPLLFALVGLPFSLLRRASVYTGFGFSFLFLFVYYFTMLFAFGLGVRGKLPLFLGSYAPSLLFLVVGTFAFWRWVKS